MNVVQVKPPDETRLGLYQLREADGRIRGWLLGEESLALAVEESLAPAEGTGGAALGERRSTPNAAAIRRAHVT